MSNDTLGTGQKKPWEHIPDIEWVKSPLELIDAIRSVWWAEAIWIIRTDKALEIANEIKTRLNILLDQIPEQINLNEKQKMNLKRIYEWWGETIDILKIIDSILSENTDGTSFRTKAPTSGEDIYIFLDGNLDEKIQQLLVYLWSDD